MRHAFVILFSIALGATGCGGEQQHADGPQGEHHAQGEPHAHGEHGEHGGHHEDENKGPLGEVHGVLAPVWHSPEGPERIVKACEQAQVMRDKSAAVEAAPAPEGADAAAYMAAAKDMTAAGDALVAACAADGRPDVAAKLGGFHDAFHKTVEKVGGKPHEHHD